MHQIIRQAGKEWRTGGAAAMRETLVVMIALQVIREGLEFAAAPLLPDTRFAQKMCTMSAMLLLTGVVIAYARLRKVRLSVFPQRFSRGYIACTLGAAALMIATPSNYLEGLPAICTLLYGSIVTPVYEELLFRGFIWNRFAPFVKGRRSALLLNAALFGLWHIGYMIPQLLAGNLFAVGSKLAVGLIYGVILGFVRLKTRNCYATMLLHGVMNLFAF